MDSHSITLLLILFFLLVMSFYFGATEIAFFGLNRIRIQHMAENGSKRAQLVLKLHADRDLLLSTILVGNNVANISAASISAVLFIRYLGEDVGVIVSTVVLTAVVLVFCEVTPKSLAKEAPEKFALFAAPILNFLIFILKPVNFFFSKWNSLLNSVFKLSSDSRGITEQELLTIVEEAEREGAIGKDDKGLINKALRLRDVEAQDVLTPRMNIVGTPKDAEVAEVAEIFLRSGFSRIPVYDKSIDNIVGIVHLRDFMEHMLKKYVLKEKVNFENVIGPAYFTAPSTKIRTLFKNLQKEKSHMAVVADEHGGTAGIVTLEDIFEELLGEILDEKDQVIEEFVLLEDNKYKVICSADIEKMFEYFNLSYKNAHPKVTASTVSGWLMDMLGKIPEEGDAFDYENLHIFVNKVAQRKALECIVSVN